MNSRRSFFRQLLGGTVLAGGAAQASIPASAGTGSLTTGERLPLGSNDHFRFHRYEIRWTGWKSRQDSDCIVGQWLAYDRIRDLRYYAGSGGAVGLFRRGDMLNITVFDGPSFWADLSTAPEKLSEIRLATLERLLNYLGTASREAR